ncbi:NAD-dependent deacylase [Virgibacillus alimentarius]|uniref:protein acetyllysine N-acetyltransferase n=1 Tax=Virgibacillus alimentarius TaxID=698769 RepID=A0ABS4SD31_9BACI|nr:MULTISPECIES: NAD-dependent deacylase [Virgibacillus]MBP2258905.1 NAD-dependent deacetylase [Virgibacillus alimentarius]HLR69744.1 NAD-dependent deacylase [Virgibacillus sp.]
MQEFVDLLTASKYTIVFTGAGMSTESGLPDFRSKERGLWTKFNPDELANVDALKHNQEEFTDFYRFRLSEINKYQPHEGHTILAKWEKADVIKGIITQNVDGFHHDAGNQNVMELHGTFRSFHCHQCKKTHERKNYLSGDVNCPACGGLVRPGIVLFGETLPEETFLKAELESLQADLFIVLGSSLSVSPANMFPLHAKQNGAKLAIINREPTPYDDDADYIVRDQSIKEVLTKTNALL